VERCLNAEIEYHMETEKALPERGKNRRNGYSLKTIKGTFGEAERFVIEFEGRFPA
jgi:transposase-like protein